MSARYDAIVIGGGAAGLFCAGIAAQRGKRVLVLERNREVGAKILISGGGRCNFTNLEAGDHRRYLSANPDFARSALSRFAPEDFLARVRKHRIAFHEKTLGQLFCEGPGSARKIVRLLLDEAQGAEIRTGTTIGAVARTDRFSVETEAGAFEAPALVLATGGLSIPKLGASDFTHRIARQFGLPLVDPRPGLVPLTMPRGAAGWAPELAGVSAHAQVGLGPGFREAALFTHRGLSGPAILQASSYWDAPGKPVPIDWLPDGDEDFLIAAKRRQPGALPKTALAQRLPERLAALLASEEPARPLGDWRDEALRDFMRRRVKQRLYRPSGTEGYAKAEVTVGGVAVSGLSQRTMEARSAPGLYIIGEAVDVTGWLGGYNFHWAWASGYVAGQAIP